MLSCVRVIISKLVQNFLIANPMTPHTTPRSSIRTASGSNPLSNSRSNLPDCPQSIFDMLRLRSVGGVITECDWRAAMDAQGAAAANDADAEAESQLREYLAGRRTAFTCPVKMEGTPFQREVWQALMQIPYGATVTYADVARMIGRPRAVRAVANAIGANKISIFIPCHRVVRTDGSIGGYRGTPAAKHRLLTLEQAVIAAY